MQNPEAPETEPIQDDASGASVNSTGPQRGLNPILLLFLIFPILGIGVAIIMGVMGRQPGSVSGPQPAFFTPTTLVGSLAPDFTLKTPDGGTVSLSNLRGKWVFLNFWATWCAPCREEMPVFQQTLNGRFGDYRDQLVILGVDQGEDAGTVKAFLRDLKVNVPVVLDTDQQVDGAYGVLQLPETFVIDPLGRVRYWQIGEMTPDLTRQYLQKELGNSATF